MTPRESMRVLNEPASRLQLVNTDTGEAHGRISAKHRTREELLAINEQLKGKLDGYLLQIDNLKREVADQHSTAADIEDVRKVAEYWSRRVEEEGWWSRKPQVKPGSQRWQNIKARLKDHSVFDCYIAVDGAVLQDRKGLERAYVDAKSIFRNEENFDSAFERAKDPMLERVRSNLIELPRDVPRKTVDQLLERCDCGHRFYDHHKQLFTDEGKYVDDDICGLFACSGCDCMHFDQAHQRAEQWIREQIELQKKGHDLSDSAKAALA